MAKDIDRKVPNNISLTQRQTSWLRKEAQRLGISFGDKVRRLVDDAMERQPTLANKLYGEGR